MFQAWEEFAKGKRKKVDVGIFERDLEDNIFSLYNELEEKTYSHGGYQEFYVRDPKVRHIHKACVKDRGFTTLPVKCWRRFSIQHFILTPTRVEKVRAHTRLFRHL